MKLLTVPMELKNLGDKGEFSGYASVFGNTDLGGDVVERGAFKEIVRTRDGMVRVLYQHVQSQPIGKARVFEDDIGLGFDGELVLEVPQARSAYALMKAGITDGMSIGYDVLPGGAQDDGKLRRLRDLKLWEISVVTFGMNEAARIEAVKKVATVRELETLLRDAGGFSWKEAKAIAAHGFKAYASLRDEGDESAASDALAALLRGFKPSL